MAKIPPKLRQEIKERAKGFCEYCRSNSKFSESFFEVEHILPKAKGGKDIAENLAFSCRGCNIHKSTYTEAPDPLSKKIVPLFNPRTDNWYEHFAWSDDFTLIIGLTALGRATVETLKLNRVGLMNQRKVLYSYGEHPPE